MKILITCFEPFGNNSTNASEKAVELLPEKIDGAEIVKLTLPVQYDLCGSILAKAVDKHRPAAVICTGLAARRTSVTPEYVAINIKDSSSPDNSGNVFSRTPIVTEGEHALYSSLPISEMIGKMEAAGIPASLSFDAGTYVCNNLFYSLMYKIKTEDRHILGGFIHLPPERILPSEKAAEALAICVKTLTV